MDFLGFANTELSLGLGLIHSTSSVVANNNRSSSDDHHNYPLEPSLTLALSSGTDSSLISNSTTVKKEEISNYQVLANHEESDIRAVVINMTSCEEEEEEEDDDEDGGGVNGRKKLRLTKSQSGLLEEAFKLHPTLYPKQKQELARDLKLRPRQVEVWFQNRRARRKLKQTEVECEYLKKWCKTLTEENQRLRREVQQLKAQKPDLYMQLPSATLTICPSCEHHTNSATTTTTNTTTKSPFIMKPYFFNPFTSSSAAC